MTVGVVIVTYNAAPYVERCLGALAEQTRPPDRIVVVDNASTDGTAALVRRATASLALPVEIDASAANLGFAAANNRAVDRLGDCELIATLNPDAFPEREWLGHLIAAAERHRDAASFGSRLVTAEDRTVLDGIGDVFHVSGLAWRRGHQQPLADVADAEREQPIFSPCAAAALYRRSDWIAAGGFDERFFCYAEDVDLGFRLQLAGRGAYYVPAAVALHMGSAASSQRSGFAVYHGHRNLEWVYLKNMPARLLLRYLPLHVLTSLFTVMWFAARGAAGTIIKAKFDALRGAGAMWRERRRVQAARRVSADDISRRLDRTSLWRRLRERARYA